MSDSIVINVVQEAAASIEVNDTGENIYLNPLTLNQGIINHSVTHQSGGSDELSHNLLGGLNGGASGVYMHLTSGEYADLVYKTGNQSIAGVKSFTNDIYGQSVYASGAVSGDSFQFDTSANITVGVGQMAWNDIDGTLDIGMKGGNVTLQVGQEILARVVNKTNANLLESEFKVVRIRNRAEGGAQGQRLAVVLAKADNEIDSATTLGVVTENIANNQEGFITTFGQVHGINTKTVNGETWEDGDMLFLSPTIAGALTKVKPQAPQHTVVMGYVEYAHQTQGKIFVKVDNGYELDELHNIKIADLQNNNILKYNSGSGVWTNQTLTTGDVSGLSSYATTNYVTGISGGLQTQITVLNSQTGNYTLHSETGAFYPRSNPSGFITGVNLSNYATIPFVTGVSGYLQGQISTLNSQTGEFYLTSNPSGYITGINNIVYITGNQIISGLKTFEDNLSINASLNLSGTTSSLTITDTSEDVRNLISISSNAGELFTLDNYGIAKFVAVGDLNYNWSLLGNIDATDAHFNKIDSTDVNAVTIYGLGGAGNDTLTIDGKLVITDQIITNNSNLFIQMGMFL